MSESHDPAESDHRTQDVKVTENDRTLPETQIMRVATVRKEGKGCVAISYEPFDTEENQA